VNESKYCSNYDGNNNLTDLFKQTWDGSIWKNYSYKLYTYSENNNLIESVFKTWNYATWVDNSKNAYIYYDNNNPAYWLKQNWNGSTWVNESDYSYTYDFNNKLTELIHKTWDDSIWINVWKNSYTNDENNNCTEWIWESWDGSNWLNSYRYSYTYIQATVVNEDLSSVNSYYLSNNYPNPFNPTTSIQYAISSRQFVSLKVYDILGIEIETLVNEEKPAGVYELNWNAANLPSGVYFYRLQAGEFVQTRKMILLK
jgi:hypothetical protein